MVAMGTITKAYAIIEQQADFPKVFSITLYFEEIYKAEQEGHYYQLLEYLRALDAIFSQSNSTDA